MLTAAKPSTLFEQSQELGIPEGFSSTRRRANLDQAMKHQTHIVPAGFILGSIALGGCFIYVSVSHKTLTILEGTLLQLFTLSCGLIGSYLIGKRQAELIGKKQAEESLKSYGQSALRRIWTLYMSLSQVAKLIANEDIPLDPPAKLLTIKELITTQLITADAALEDWKDIVPGWREFLPSNPEDMPTSSPVKKAKET